jgi:hypothetical protein
VQPPPLVQPVQLPPLVQQDPLEKEFATEIAQGFTFRRSAGIWFAVTGCLVIGSAIVWAEMSIDAAIGRVIGTQADKLTAASTERLLFAILAVQAIVSVAAVYFGYSMLRAAERLFVPQRLLTDSKDVELVRAILGIDTPAKAAADQLKNVAEQMSAMAKPMGEIVKPVIDALKNAAGADKK